MVIQELVLAGSELGEPEGLSFVLVHESTTYPGHFR